MSTKSDDSCDPNQAECAQAPRQTSTKSAPALLLILILSGSRSCSSTVIGHEQAKDKEESVFKQTT